MKKLNITLSLCLLAVLTSCTDDCFLGFIGPGCDDDDIEAENFEEFAILIENTETIETENKVKVRFKLIDQNDVGVQGKFDSDFNLYESVINENEQLIDPLEAPRKIVPSPDSYGYATAIVMDLSGSVIDEIESIKSASKEYVNNLFDNINSGNLEVGVFYFDGRSELQTVIDFSNSRSQVTLAIDGMNSDLQVNDNTALYHGVVQACNNMTAKKLEYASNSNIKIFSSSLVIFSDGRNTNLVDIDRLTMNNKISQTSNGTLFFCIAAGENTDFDVVNDIGLNGIFPIDNYSELNQGLNEVLDLITKEANSNYELEICTARVGASVNYRLEVKNSYTSGGTGIYNTTNFSEVDICTIGN